LGAPLFLFVQKEAFAALKLYSNNIVNGSRELSAVLNVGTIDTGTFEEVTGMSALRFTGIIPLSFVIGFSTSAAMAECGIASNYSGGKVTANGERFNPNGLSAAHKRLPFGAKVAVINRRTGRSIVVRVNDRGPFAKGRIIDLSRGAARALGSGGLAFVCVRVLRYGAQTVRLRETSFHGSLGLAARLARAAN
jgi:rare lipoprotein A